MLLEVTGICKLLKNIQCLLEEHVHVSHCLVLFFFDLGELVRSPASWNLARRWRLRIACFCPILLPCHISCIQDSSQDHWTLIWEFDIIQNECLGKRTQILPLFFFFYSELLYLSQNTALVHFLSVMKKLPSFESLSISWQLVWNYVIATYRNELLIKSPAERIAISVLETGLFIRSFRLHHGIKALHEQATYWNVLYRSWKHLHKTKV